MASKKTVNLENLAALGSQRLATIILELSEGDAEIKRRLRLELAAEVGGDAIAAEIGKRLTALRTARSFIGWEKSRDFAKDLDTQRMMIADRVTQTRPDLALDLIWRFMDLADPVLGRVDDSNGNIGDVFRAACANLCEIAAKATPNPVHLADRVFDALLANDYGVFDDIVESILPVLRKAGTAHLKSRLAAALAGQQSKREARDWREEVLRRALKDIADGEGDVDEYIALVPVESRRLPRIAAEIGHRLISANRAGEAIVILESARSGQGAPGSGRRVYPRASLAGEWEDAYIAALDATARSDQAQELRWAAFEERLSPIHLRAYLKKLPDFDDVEAEERAMQYALGFHSFPAALEFLVNWPDYARAAQLVLSRPTEIDGNLYFLLDPSAQALEGNHPLAATLLRRAMIDDTLNGTKSTRYKHAARHLLECRSLASFIQDYGSFETHDAFVQRLHAKHGRKVGFWSLVCE